jgi:hypothetical protein
VSIIETLARANNTQRSVLIATIFFFFFSDLFTWDLVINRGIAKEAAEWTSIFISRYGTLGLLISFGIFFSSFVVFWVIWVWASKGERGLKRWDHQSIGAISVGISMMVFTLMLFDFANDLIQFGFGSNLVLQLMNPPIIPMILAILLAFNQIYPKPKRTS